MHFYWVMYKDQEQKAGQAKWPLDFGRAGYGTQDGLWIVKGLLISPKYLAIGTTKESGPLFVFVMWLPGE